MLLHKQICLINRSFWIWMEHLRHIFGLKQCNHWDSVVEREITFWSELTDWNPLSWFFVIQQWFNLFLSMAWRIYTMIQTIPMRQSKQTIILPIFNKIFWFRAHFFLFFDLCTQYKEIAHFHTEKNMKTFESWQNNERIISQIDQELPRRKCHNLYIYTV